MSVRSPYAVVNIPWRNNNFSVPARDPPLSDQGETVVGIYLLLLGWLSWVGNSVVMLVMWRRGRGGLLPCDLLTLSLAASDAGVAVFGYSRGILQVFNLLRDDGYLITSIWTCQVDGFFTLVFGLSSIHTLTVISVTRYIKGCHPTIAHCITPKAVLSCLLFVWLAAIFWSSAPLLGWGSYTDRGYGTCEIDWTKASFSTIYKSYIISILIFCFLLPVLVMLFSYVSIINTVKRRHGNANAASSQGARGGKGGGGDIITERQRKVERDVTVVSIVACTAFILAWSPYAVVSMWSAWGYQVPSLTSIFTRLFAKSASFYNPVIYVGLSARFRSDAARLLPCRCPPRGHKDPHSVRLRRFRTRAPEVNYPNPYDLPPPPPIPTPPCLRTGARGEERKEEKRKGGVAGSPDSGVGVGSPPATPPPPRPHPEVFYIEREGPSESQCERL